MATVAGALAGWAGSKTTNAKNPPRERWAGATYLSTSDKSFRYLEIGAHIRRRFPHASRWEASDG
jgi:hypothetical protein